MAGRERSSAIPLYNVFSITLTAFSLFCLPSSSSFSLPPSTDSLISPATNPSGAYDPDSSGVTTGYNTTNPGGLWTVVTTKSGVSGVHWVITPIVNTLVMIDRSDKDNSYLTLSDGRPAFACAHDLANPAAGPRALDVIYNAFCSGGIFWPNGTLVVQGGYQEVSGADIGYNAVRNLDPCPANGTCDFYEYKGVTLLAKRWYPTAHIMPEGDRLILIGGSTQGFIFLIDDEASNSATYEFHPRTKAADMQLRPMPLLERASPAVLYPFLHLMPNGYFFVMANYQAVLFNFDTGDEIVLPDIPGKICRSYPWAGSSVLLPLSSANNYTHEILVCGGSIFDSDMSRDKKASDTCGRIRPLDPNPQWEMETMPDARIMADLILTANGQVMLVNGARQGRAGNSNGTSFAHNPVLTPALYNPRAPNGTRWVNLDPTTIGRLYHSLATLGPDGAILIGGSAPYDCCAGCGPTCYESYGYTCTNAPNADCYPSEYTIERFFPPYFYNSAVPQPVISSAPAAIAYGQAFEVVFHVRPGLKAPAVRAAIVNSGFGTHSQHMGHRFVWLDIDYANLTYSASTGDVTASVTAPPSNLIAPPGYYYLFCHDANIPSESVWVQLT